MNKEDYSKYYIQGSDHYLIPKDELVCLLKEIKELQSQLSYLRSGEYFNQLRFERDMLQHIVDYNEVSKEDKEFIDMTHRNTELLEENQKLKEEIYKSNATADTHGELAESYYKENQQLKKQLQQKEDIINKLKDLLDDDFLEVIDRNDLLKILNNKGDEK